MATKIETPFALRPQTAPGSPVNGELYYDSTAKRLKTHDGTQWNRYLTDADVSTLSGSPSFDSLNQIWSFTCNAAPGFTSGEYFHVGDGTNSFYGRATTVVGNTVTSDETDAGNLFQEIGIVGSIPAGAALVFATSPGATGAAGATGATGATGVYLGLYDPGSLTATTESFLLQYNHLKLSGSERLTLPGTSEVFLSNFTPSISVGTPKTPSVSFTVPTEYFLDQMLRLTLLQSQRATLQGTADLIITDDFAARSRIVLAGSSRVQ